MFMLIFFFYLLIVEWNNFIMEIFVLLIVLIKLSWLKFYIFGDSDFWDFGVIFMVISSLLFYNFY